MDDLFERVSERMFVFVHVRALGVKHSNKLCKQTRTIGEHKNTFCRRHSFTTLA